MDSDEQVPPGSDSPASPEGGSGLDASRIEDDDLVEMPLLIDGTLDRALDVIKSLGLPPPQLRYVEGKQLGRVRFQWPDAGEVLDFDTAPYLEVEEENPIRMLPEIFQEEDEREEDPYGGQRPANFLREFLFIPKSVMGSLDRSIRGMHRSLSVDEAEEPMLRWLLSLLPIEVDASWSVEQMRRILADAPALLRLRGTTRGLVLMIQLYTGLKAIIRENVWPHNGFIIAKSLISQEAIVSSVPPPDRALTIELVSDETLSRDQIERVLRVVDREKPAYVRAAVVQSSFRGDPPVIHSPIGLGSVIGRVAIGGSVVTPPARIAVGFDPILDAEQVSRALGGESLALNN